MSSALVNQVIMIFLLAAVGYLCRRFKIIDSQVQMGLSALVLNVSIPASILAAAAKPFAEEDLAGILLVLGGAALYYVASLLLASLLARALPLDKDKKLIFTLLTVFANVAFLGYPVISIFLPDNGIFFASFFVMIFNLTFFTYTSVKTAGGKTVSAAAIFGNINVIASVAMAVLYFTQIRMPAAIQSTLEILGSMSTPLSMLVIGSTLATIPLRKLFLSPPLYLIAFLRLLAIPTLIFFLLRFFHIGGAAGTVLLVLSGLPAGSTTVMVAEKNRLEADFATRGVLLSTLFFIVTMPYLAFLQSHLPA